MQLGSRKLNAAEIVTTKNESNENVFATVRRFCTLMCDKPRLPQQPVYGINDWYFAYGNNSAELILEHTALLASLATNASNRPFSVIDAGWATKSPSLPDDCCWGDDFSKSNDKFGDMQKLRKDKKIRNAARYLDKTFMRTVIRIKIICSHRQLQIDNDPRMPILDPTIGENIERIKNIIKTYKQWGFELVKHDYTTYDIFGQWGFEMKDALTAPGGNSMTIQEQMQKLY